MAKKDLGGQVGKSGFGGIIVATAFTVYLLLLGMLISIAGSFMGVAAAGLLAVFVNLVLAIILKFKVKLQIGLDDAIMYAAWAALWVGLIGMFVPSLGAFFSVPTLTVAGLIALINTVRLVQLGLPKQLRP